MVRLRSGARTRVSDPAQASSTAETEEPAHEAQADTVSEKKRSSKKKSPQAKLASIDAVEASGANDNRRRRKSVEDELAVAASQEELGGANDGANRNGSEKPKASSKLSKKLKQAEVDGEVRNEVDEEDQEGLKTSSRISSKNGIEKRDAQGGRKDVSEGGSVSKSNAESETHGRQTLVHRCAFVDFKPETVEAIAGHKRYLAVGRASGEVELWERRETSLQQKLVVPGTRSQGLRALVWHGDRLFGGNLDGTLFEVDFKNRRQIPNTPAGGGGIWSLASNGELIATACEDGRVRLYSAKALDLGVEFERVLVGSAHGRLLCIKFHGSDAANYLYTGGIDGTIRKWSLVNRRVVEHIPVPSLSRSLKVWCMDTHGEALACGDSLGRVHIWPQSETGTPQTFSEHRADVLAVTFSSDGQALFASGVDSRVASFRVAHGSWVYTYSHRAHTHDVRAQAVFNYQGDEVLCSAGIDTQLVWYPTRSFERVRPRKESPFRQRICLFSSVATAGAGESGGEGSVGRILLVAHTFRLELWHLDVESKQHSFLACIKFDDDTTLRCAAMSSSHRYVACCDDVRGLKVFRVEMASMKVEDEADDANPEISITSVQCPGMAGLSPTSICFGASDNILIASTNDQLIVFDLDASTITKRFALEHGPLVSLCCSMDGQWLAGIVGNSIVPGSEPEAAEMFNLDAMRHHAHLPGSLFGEASHSSFAFSPDSTELVLARADGSVLAFAVEERRLRDWKLSLPSFCTEKIIGLAFNPAAKEEIVAWSWSTMVVLNTTHPDRQARVFKKIKPLIHACFWGPDDLFVLEAPYVNTLKYLPDVLERERFGT